MAQSAGSETLDLIQELNDGVSDSNRYIYKNDTFCYRYTPIGEESRLLCCIAGWHRLGLLRVFHDEREHIGAGQACDLILKHFWFPGVKQFVNGYTSHWLVCVSERRVPGAPRRPITLWERSDLPFNTIHVDVFGPLPESNRYKLVLVLVDLFTKFAFFTPCTDGKLVI